MKSESWRVSLRHLVFQVLKYALCNQVLINCSTSPPFASECTFIPNGSCYIQEFLIGRWYESNIKISHPPNSDIALSLPLPQEEVGKEVVAMVENHPCGRVNISMSSFASNHPWLKPWNIDLLTLGTSKKLSGGLSPFFFFYTSNTAIAPKPLFLFPAFILPLLYLKTSQ